MMRDWRPFAACRPGTREADLDWWVEYSTVEQAEQMCAPVCGRCPVRSECAADADRWNERATIRAGKYRGDRKRHAAQLKDDGAACTNCGVPTRTKYFVYECGMELPAGWAIRHARGLCRGCYETRKTLGTLHQADARRQKAGAVA